MNLTNSLVIIAILVVKFIHVIYSLSLDDLVVPTTHGKVKGIVQRSRNSRLFLAFKGIPFAKPPVGDLRFRAPVSPDPWDGIRRADKDGPTCIQKNYLLYERPPVEGQEDCLYLNVYKPLLSDCKELIPRRRLPVMVFIHYGGFFAGTGNSDYVGPEYFMDRNVILVTFNYRLGVFGFFTTLDDAAPGNFGLKDQVAALKWVKHNIELFGGNSDRITIFGQSAGAASVHYHLLSPRSKNLFHRAISQSGSALALWARTKNPIQKYLCDLQIDMVACDKTAPTDDIVNCLRRVDANVLAGTSDLFKTFSTEPFAIFGPVTEVKTPRNPEPFIEEDPLVIIQSGKFQKLPWIIGLMEDEGILRASPMLRQNATIAALNSNFDAIGEAIFGMPLSVPKEQTTATWNKIRNFYIGTDHINVTNTKQVQGFIDLYSDRAFVYGTYQSALLHAWRGHKPVWFYSFGYRGEYSYGDIFAATKETIPFKWGASHCDDLLYLFTAKQLLSPIRSDNDNKMISLMTLMWTNFATYGDPLPITHTKNFHTQWKPLPNLEGKSSVQNRDLYYLKIGGRFDSSESPSFSYGNHGLYAKRMALWENLPLYENIPGIN